MQETTKKLIIFLFLFRHQPIIQPFSSGRDCSFRLFNCDSIQIASEIYEPSKPIIVRMSETGVFYITNSWEMETYVY